MNSSTKLVRGLVPSIIRPVAAPVARSREGATTVSRCRYAATQKREWSFFSTGNEESQQKSKTTSDISQIQNNQNGTAPVESTAEVADLVGPSTQVSANNSSGSNSSATEQQTIKKMKKTMAQLDEELRLAMEGHAGDGGESGLELEDGKPVSMKRGVRENMFRYI